MTQEEEDRYVDNEIKKFAESIGMRYYTDAEIEQIKPDSIPYRLNFAIFGKSAFFGGSANFVFERRRLTE